MDVVAAGFKGAALRLDGGAYQRAAARLGCEEAMVRAFVMTEASGSGFDYAGRPKILFEPHVFFRHLMGKPDLLERASRAGLAYPHQGMQPYPRTSDENYARLTAACAIDFPSAVAAASWGLGQVLGENCKISGFADPESFVVAAMESEELQLGFMLSYLEHTGLVPAMRSRNFPVLAHGYNGPGAVAAYSSKLSHNYDVARAGVVSTPLPQAPPPVRTFVQPAAPVAQADDNIADQLNNQEWLRIRAGAP